MTIRTYQFQVQALVTASGGVDVSRSVEHAAVVTDEAFVGEQRSVEDVITFLDEAAWFVLPFDGVTASNALDLEQIVHVFGWESVEDELNLAEDLGVLQPFTRDRESVLTFEDTVEYRYGIRNLTIEDDLGLTDTAATTLPLQITQNLDLTDQALWLVLEDQLNLTQLAEWGYGIDVIDDLDLEQEAEKDQDLNKTLGHTDVVTQAAAWFVENSCARFQFKTYHGTGGVAPQLAKLNYQSDFLFQSLKDGEVLTLRNPETDDRRRYSFNRTNRRYFDNSLDLYADDSWVTEQSQIYTIVANKRENLDLLFAFLMNNLGLEVLVKDWRGVTWRVIVINPGEVYTEDAEGRWTLDFEVVGTAIDGEYVFASVGLADDVSRAGSIYLRSGTHAGLVTDSVGRNYDEDVPEAALGFGSDATFTIETP